MKASTTWPLVVAALLALGAVPQAGTSFGARKATTFTAPGALWPTDVAVDATGRVWVADGAHDRVLIFAADGTFVQALKKVAGMALSRPMAIATTPDGGVWIADAGNRRIAHTHSRATDEQSFPIVGKEFGAVDLTDVAVNPVGTRAWVVDNDGNRLIELDVKSGRWTAKGAKGTGWGQYNRPRSVAVDAEGRLYVGDVLNGRVQRIDERGRAAKPVAPYGVTPGHVFRPAGVDVEDGRVWVADSVMGVVQAFTSEGVFLDALHDEAGQVLHFDHPIGLDVVGDKVFVVESASGRVVSYTIGAGKGPALVASEAKTTSSSASEGQECTLCHLDMMPPLDGGTATALVGVPAKKGGASWAGTETACISCHDGAVLDSRDHIWSGYAHPRGSAATVPEKMKIPADMPLVDGQIACRTCHSPHALGGSARTHRGATMLRVDDRPSELCVACHDPKGGM